MSELETVVSRTIAAYVEEPNGSGHGYIIDADDFDTLLDAARRFANLTSPETIEKGTQVVVDFIERTEPVKVNLDERAVYRSMVAAVLRSVDEGKT